MLKTNIEDESEIVIPQFSAANGTGNALVQVAAPKDMTSAEEQIAGIEEKLAALESLVTPRQDAALVRETVTDTRTADEIEADVLKKKAEAAALMAVAAKDNAEAVKTLAQAKSINAASRDHTRETGLLVRDAAKTVEERDADLNFREIWGIAALILFGLGLCTLAWGSGWGFALLGLASTFARIRLGRPPSKKSTNPKSKEDKENE